MKTWLIMGLTLASLSALAELPKLEPATLEQDMRDDSAAFQKVLGFKENELSFDGLLAAGDKGCEEKISISIYDQGLHYRFTNEPLSYHTTSLDQKAALRLKLNLHSYLNDVPGTNQKRRFKLGADSEDSFHPNSDYLYYRPLGYRDSLSYVKQGTFTKIQNNQVIITQVTKFKDVSGIWLTYFYPVVETVTKEIGIKRGPEDSIIYTVKETSEYEASKNQQMDGEYKPVEGGKVFRYLNCVYKQY